MSSTARWIGEPRIYPVNKELSNQKYIDEIEVRMSYRRDCSGGRGFYVTLTPQYIEDHGGYKMVSFDLMQVRTKKLLGCERYSKKSEAEALDILKEFEPYWVSQMASAHDLVLLHDPIHGNW